MVWVKKFGIPVNPFKTIPLSYQKNIKNISTIVEISIFLVLYCITITNKIGIRYRKYLAKDRKNEIFLSASLWTSLTSIKIQPKVAWYLDEKKNSNEIDLSTKYNNLFEDNNIIIDDNSDQSSSEHYDDNE